MTDQHTDDRPTRTPGGASGTTCRARSRTRSSATPRAAAAGGRRPRRRPRPDRGRAGRRQDAAGAGVLAGAGPRVRARPGHARPAARRRHGHAASTRPARSGSSPGPIFTNVLLVDEINRATPRTQAALLEAMQERQVSADGETPAAARAVPRPRDGEPGRARGHVRAARGASWTGSSSGSRSAIRSRDDELRDRAAVPLGGRAAGRRAGRHRRGADPAPPGRRSAQQTFGAEVLEYLVDLVRATREHPELRLGASPRSTVAMYRAAQAWAFLDGRRFVLPEDVRAVAPAVLGHRLLRRHRPPAARHEPRRDRGRHCCARCRCRSPTPRDRQAPKTSLVPRRPSPRRATRSAGACWASGSSWSAPSRRRRGCCSWVPCSSCRASLRTLWSRYGLRSVALRAPPRARPRGSRRGGGAAGLGLERQARCRWRGSRPSDLVSDGTIVRERPVPGATGRASRSLRSTWTLGPWERVTTHLHVGADKRGVYRFGPVRLQVADLFGRDVAPRVRRDRRRPPRPTAQRPGAACATPELAPLGERGRATASTTTRAVRRGPSVPAHAIRGDPSTGGRPPGWASRSASATSRRRSRRTVVAVDMQTNDEPYWMMVYDEEHPRVARRRGGVDRAVRARRGRRRAVSPRTPGAAR